MRKAGELADCLSGQRFFTANVGRAIRHCPQTRDAGRRVPHVRTQLRMPGLFYARRRALDNGM
jgi:hypothetical protein